MYDNVHVDLYVGDSTAKVVNSEQITTNGYNQSYSPCWWFYRKGS